MSEEAWNNSSLITLHSSLFTDPGQRMKRKLVTLLALFALLASCASYNAFERGRTAEKLKNWDQAVREYQKALDVDPGNMRYQIFLQRARLEASRVHFERGKSLRSASLNTSGGEQF